MSEPCKYAPKCQQQRSGNLPTCPTCRQRENRRIKLGKDPYERDNGLVRSKEACSNAPACPHTVYARGLCKACVAYEYGRKKKGKPILPFAQRKHHHSPPITCQCGCGKPAYRSGAGAGWNRRCFAKGSPRAKGPRQIARIMSLTAKAVEIAELRAKLAKVREYADTIRYSNQRLPPEQANASSGWAFNRAGVTLLAILDAKEAP